MAELALPSAKPPKPEPTGLQAKPAVEWTPAETSQFLLSIGLGDAGKNLAAYVEEQEIPGYMLVANSERAQDLVEMFGACV